MKPKGSAPRFPDLDRLTTGLTTVLRENGGAHRVNVLRRERNPYESSFPTEIVTCRVGDATNRLCLFIKYGRQRFDHGYGHRGDVAYEARVYGEVLQPLRVSTPAYYGVHHARGTRLPWLVLEYVTGGVRASHFDEPRVMVQAARWIGKFHAANERRVRGRTLAFLRTYDDTYYRGWPRRADRLYAPWRAEFPWLSPLGKEFQRRIPTLLGATPTVIHGEYFGQNILYRRGRIAPLDWQSAAIAPGEIDLVSLTHSWPASFVSRCQREYRKSRWPGGAPESFDEIVAAARLYVDFRWLGDPRRMTPPIGPRGPRRMRKRARKFLTDLYGVGKALGSI